MTLPGRKWFFGVLREQRCCGSSMNAGREIHLRTTAHNVREVARTAQIERSSATCFNFAEQFEQMGADVELKGGYPEGRDVSAGRLLIGSSLGCRRIGVDRRQQGVNRGGKPRKLAIRGT
jgi:hypothetical protein